MNLAFKREGAGSGKQSGLPGSLQSNPRLSQWLRVDAGGTVSITSGKVEIGQGIATALAQIAAEELGVSLERIRMVPANTAESPNEAVTSGSMSIQESGTALRHACAETRAIFLALAADRLGVSAAQLGVVDGRFMAADGRETSYWALCGEISLAREATGTVAPRHAEGRRLVGSSLPRTDLPDKFFGRPRYVQDLDLPGMLFGRIVRPPSPSASLEGCGDAAGALPGVVAVVRDGSFLGVVAEREEIAVKAAKRLAANATWRESESLPDEYALSAYLKEQACEDSVIENAPGREDAPRRLEATYTRPYLAHGSIGPSTAAAIWRDGELEVWSHSQGIFNLRADLAKALELPPEKILVRHAEGAGCYGHNGADDVAMDAALLAMKLPAPAAGRPVLVQWSREDELSWSPFGAAMRIEMQAGLDANGNIIDWRHELWSNGHTSRPGRAKLPALLAAWHLAKPFEQPPAINPPLPSGGADRNAIPLYDVPARRIVNHRLLAMPLRTSALRSLGGYANVFAIESFLDELAAAAGVDPVEYRLRHLKDGRGRAVIEAVARKAGWRDWKKKEGWGHGIGFARYKNLGAWCAVIAEIEAEREIRVRRIVIAVDVGAIINPDGLANQIEGGAVQSTSWTLKEAVRFDRTRVTSSTWEAYPILKFSEVPAVEVELIDRPGERSLGAGEAAQGPTAAAIANAVFDALGVRARELPLTAERIAAAAA